MYINSGVIFRGSLETTVNLLPPSLEFLRPDIFYNGDMEWVQCAVTLGPARTQEVIDWGSQLYEGESIIKAINMEDRYEFDDVKDEAAVEIYPASDAFEASVGNLAKTYDTRWACAYCARVDVTQVGDLSASPHGAQKIQPTKNGEWIAHASLREMLEKNGVAVRPLYLRSDYLQIVPQDFMFCADIAPSQMQDDACPGCGNRSLYRSETLPGDWIGVDSPAISIRRAQPLTVPKDELSGLAWKRSSQGFKTFAVPSTPQHERGAPAPIAARVSRYSSIIRVDIVSPPLLKALLEVGAGDLAFRPVRVLGAS